MKEVVDAGLEASSKIYELEDLSDVDHDGLIRRKGANKECPIDKKISAAYVHSIENVNAVGRATIMLSYAWAYTIGDIVNTLRVYCRDNGKDPEDVYVWICCLCVNQHRVIELKKEGKDISFDGFRAVFNKRVNEIGHIVAMMAPWQEPFYLTRIWCIFEMFTAQKNDCKITITMPSAEKARFIMGLTSEDGNNQLDALFSTLAKTDVTKAKASVESDLTDILKIVNKGVGYAEFNKAVSGLLREWAIGIVIGAVEEGRGHVEDETAKKLQGLLCNKVSFLLFSILEGHEARGLSIAREWLVLNDKVYGRESVHAAQSLLSVGNGLYTTRNVEDAFETYKEALAIFERVHEGRVNEDVAEVLFHMGSVLHDMGDKEEALKIWREPLLIQETLFG